MRLARRGWPRKRHVAAMRCRLQECGIVVRRIDRYAFSAFLMLWLSMIAAVGLASPGYVVTFHVKHLMDAIPRSVVMAAVELIVHRAARR